MKKFHMIIDLNKCVGCFNCMLACKDEYVGNDWLPYTYAQQKHEDKWICPTLTERGEAPYTEVTYVTRTCMHCDNAPCMEKCPDAIYKRSDGLVIIDPRKAKNNEALKTACPYGMIQWNEEKNMAQKCTGCAHLIDQGWKEPRCVQTCPCRALQTVFCEDYEWDKIVDAQGLRSIVKGSNKPRVMYKNLFMLDKCFVKGALAFDKDGIEEAAIGAKVELLKGNTVVETTETNFLGEYYIDKIPKDSGDFTIKASFEGYDPIKIDFTIERKSVCLDCYKFGSTELGKPAFIPVNEHSNELAIQHMTVADAKEAKQAAKDFAKGKDVVTKN